MNTVTPITAEPAPATSGLIEVRVNAIRYAARDTHMFEFTPLDGKALPSYQPARTSTCICPTASCGSIR